MMSEEKERRYTKGQPSCIGLYDCQLEDGREVVVFYRPGWDCEIHPYGERIHPGAVIVFRRIPGQRYRS